MKKISNFYKKNKKVLISLFLISIIVYSYCAYNLVVNVDGINDLMILNKSSDYKLYLSVGRYGWALIGLIFNYYPSSIFCLILNSILFSVSGVIINDVLDIKKEKYQILLPALMISFPINWMLYSYIPWQYIIGISYLLISYICYRIKNIKNYKDIIIICFLTSFLTSIYQIMLLFIVIICCYFILKDIISNNSFINILKKIGLYLLIGLLSIGIYYLFVKLSLYIFDIKLISYQHADKMFSLNINEMITNLPVAIGKTIKVNFESFFPSSVHIIFKLLILLSIVLIFIKTNINKYAFVTLSIILLIISPRLFVYLKPDVTYHVLTLVPYSLFYLTFFSILINKNETLNNKKIVNIIDKIITIVLVFSLFAFIMKSNQYFIMNNNATKSSFYFLNRLQARIEDTPGYSDLSGEKKYYIYSDDFFYDFPQSNNAYYKDSMINYTFILSTKYIISAFNVLGIDCVDAKEIISYEDESEILELIKDKKEYPSDDSIFIYKDIIVIYMESE